MIVTSQILSAIRTDEYFIVRAKNRLLRLKRKLLTWRAVGAELDINHGYAVSLVKHDKVPKNKKIRHVLGLPVVMPSERAPRIVKPVPLLGSVGWEDFFFKKLKGHKR